eukprot:9313298-Alexandrium_andersonii.AAC.1
MARTFCAGRPAPERPTTLFRNRLARPRAPFVLRLVVLGRPRERGPDAAAAGCALSPGSPLKFASASGLCGAATVSLWSRCRPSLPKVSGCFPSSSLTC